MPSNEARQEEDLSFWYWLRTRIPKITDSQVVHKTVFMVLVLYTFVGTCYGVTAVIAAAFDGIPITMFDLKVSLPAVPAGLVVTYLYWYNNHKLGRRL